MIKTGARHSYKREVRATDGLTKRQIEVLTQIGYGFATKEIAVIMKKTPKTVEHHRANLYRIFPALSSSLKLARLAIGFGLSSLCLMCVAAAAQPFLVVSNPSPVVQVAWSPPATGNPISFYYVYYGTGSGQYTTNFNVGNVTNFTVTLPTRGATYFLAVTAVDSHGLQSPFSNEVSYSTPLPPGPPTQKPLTIITVMKSTKPDGAFADAGMHWSDTPDQASAYYKLKIDKGMILAVTPPPMPHR